jgi:hypothetical protein
VDLVYFPNLFTTKKNPVGKKNVLGMFCITLSLWTIYASQYNYGRWMEGHPAAEQKSSKSGRIEKLIFCLENSLRSARTSLLHNDYESCAAALIDRIDDVEEILSECGVDTFDWEPDAFNWDPELCQPPDKLHRSGARTPGINDNNGGGLGQSMDDS